MSVTEEKSSIQQFEVSKDVVIEAPIDVVFDAILAELGPESQLPGKPFPMTLEAWPGGRWFRDLGNNTGHLWGHVQVIKPPTLLELNGPMFMSFPAANHLQYRLVSEGTGTRMKLLHRSFGLIPEEMMTGVHHGWEFSVHRIRDIAERIRNERKKETK